jgi:uncharacterized membrane-anchored protein YitT (DUF2179 family)
MTTLPEKAAVFVVLALFNIAIFFISYDSLGTASTILYKDALLLPIVTTLITAFISFGGVLTYTLWLKHAQNAIVDVLDASGHDDLADALDRFANPEKQGDDEE